MALEQNKLTENPKIDLFLEDTIENFKSKKTEKEVEFKVFLDGEKNRNKIWIFHRKLQNKLISNLKGKNIFDGKIEDTRYYNSDDDRLEKNKISMIRVRNQTDKNSLEIKSIYTVKQRIGDSKEDGYEALEYENNVDKNFGEKILVGKYGLEEIKKSSKNRKEIEFEIYVSGQKEKVKIAFDEYIDEKNKDILPFFEVEAKSQKIVDRGFEEIKKLFPDAKFSGTTGGPSILHKQNKREKLIDGIKEDGKNIPSKSIRKNILDSVVLLLEDVDIYKIFDKINLGNEKNSKINNEDLHTDLKNNIKKLLEKNLNQIIKNKNFERYFHRILTNTSKKNDPRKKFFDKFEREYSGYMKAFFNSVIEGYKIEIEKGDNNPEKLKELVNSKLNIFLKSLFMFDDSLTKDELEKILSGDEEKVITNFEKYSENISEIFNTDKFGTVPKIWNFNYNFGIKIQGFINNKIVWKENNEYFDVLKYGYPLNTNNDRVLNKLVTSYSRAFSTVPQKGKEIGDKEIISEKVENIEKEQFSFLARQFSHWLNSPKRELSTFDTIKNLLKEDFYHIFLLANKGLAFLEFKNCNFDQDFIDKVIEKYGDVLFKKSNFQVEKKGPELFKIFSENIFEESNDISEGIISKFKKFNIYQNNNLIKKEEENNNIESINSNNITFNLWKDIKIEPRIFLFLNKVLGIKKDKNKGKKGLEISNLFIKSSNKINKHLIFFAEIEFRKISKIENDFSDKQKKGFKEYISEITKQFNKLNSYISDNNLENKSIIDIGKHLSKNDINSFNLLVSWFQFNIKLKHSGDLEGVKDLSLFSESFSENVLNGIGKDILENDDFEFITSTSSAYNTSISTNKRIIELHDRIGNDKSINVSESFYFENGGNKFLFKDLTTLYLQDDYDTARIFLEDGIKTTRDLLNGDTQNINQEYLEILNKIGFPIKNTVSLKKLLEFQKYIFKEVLPVINKLYSKGDDATNGLANDIADALKTSGDYEHSNDTKIDSGKEFESIYRKIITKYGGDIEQIADITRATIFGDNFEDLSNKITNFIKEQKQSGKVSSIRFEDKIGNLFKKSKRANGYRDATLAITYNDGSAIEIQFQLKPYYAIKAGNLEVTERNNVKLLSLKGGKYGFEIKDFNIGKKIKEENILFTDNEKKLIIDYVKNTNNKLSNNFAKLFNIETEYICADNFNADYTYNLQRTVGLGNKGIEKKLKKLDRILFDIPNGELAEKEIVRIMDLYKN